MQYAYENNSVLAVSMTVSKLNKNSVPLSLKMLRSLI